MLAVLLVGLLAQDPVLVGRVVDYEGRPRKGVEVKVDTGKAPDQTRTDAEGRFRLLSGFSRTEYRTFERDITTLQDRSVTSPEEVPYVLLRVSAPGCAPVMRSIVARVGDDPELEVEDFVLDAPGVIVARIVDSAGEVLREASLLAFPGERSMVELRHLGPLHAKVDPATGEARLTDLAVGTYRVLSRTGAARAQFHYETVEVIPGGETFLEMRVEEEESGTAKVELDTGGFNISLRPRHLHLEAMDGTVQAVELRSDAVVQQVDPLLALELPSGPHLLTIDHPRFAAAGPVFVQRDQTARVRLVPRGALSMRITGPTQPPRGRFTATRKQGGEQVDFFVGTLVDVQGEPLVRRLPPGTWVIEVVPEGLTTRWNVVDMGRDEVRELEVDLGPVDEVLVAQAAGHGRALLRDAEASIRRRPTWWRDPWRALGVDPTGRLVLGQIPPDPHVLRLRWSPWIAQDVSLEAPRGLIELETPQTAMLAGRLLLPDELDPQRLDVLLGQHSVRHGDSRLLASHVPVGPLGLWAVIDGGQTFHVYGATASAGEVLAPVIDLTEHDFGPTSLRMVVDGAPYAEAVVYLQAGSDRTFRLTTDAQGGASLVDVPVGAYRLWVRDILGGWVWSCPGTFEVSAAWSGDWRVEVPLITRELVLYDQEGHLARLRGVHVGTGEGEQVCRVIRHASDRGTLRLSLPAGPVRLGLVDGGPLSDLRRWDADMPRVVTLREDE